MQYRITFRERTNAAGEPSEFPADSVDIEAADGVIVDRSFVEREEPAAVHNEDRLEEDDDFLSVGTETWDYEIDDDREDEFLAAVKASKMALECLRLSDEKSGVDERP